MNNDDFFKDQDEIPELDYNENYEIGPLDWTLIQDQIDRMETSNDEWNSITNPDVTPLHGHPKDDQWTYGDEYEKAKRDKELEKVDYEELAEQFEKNSKKDWTNKEKSDILNKIIWSEE